MARVSKEKLKKKVLEQINFRLVDTIAKLETNSSAKDFINDLLGEEEKIVLAKRLAIIFMLQENISWYRISRLLKVSPSTVRKIVIDIDLKKYENILKIVKQKKNRITFWVGMDLVLKMGIPSLVGAGPWNILDEIYEKYQIKKHKD
ncbi:MAG: helix-turn-helix domain-containing protein [Candidatus Pacebacteria bacterium]|nr:helix-turn-helix domain-containing protein [Candidatus Paceibacterota bacterium]